MAAYPTTAPVVPKVSQSDTDSLKTEQADTQKVDLQQQQASTATKAAGTTTSGTAMTQDPSSESMSSMQANKIMSEDSPLMRLSRQQGMLSAARRGLGNSSIAAGAAQGEATKQAVPLAQQDAATVSRQELANQAAVNQMEGLNVTEANKANLTDAEAQNRMQQQYDDMVARGDMADAEAFNKAAMQKHSTDAEVNRTWLSGEISQTMAHIQGQYQEIISVNQAASQMYGNTMDGLAEMWASSAPLKQKTAYTTSTVNFLENSLKVTASIASMDFRTSAGGAGVEMTKDQVDSGTYSTNTNTNTTSTKSGDLSWEDRFNQGGL